MSTAALSRQEETHTGNADHRPPELDVAESLPELDVVSAEPVTVDVEEVDGPDLHFSNETQAGIEELEALRDSFDSTFEFVNSMETRRFRTRTGHLRVRIRHDSRPHAAMRVSLWVDRSFLPDRRIPPTVSFPNGGRWHAYTWRDLDRSNTYYLRFEAGRGGRYYRGRSKVSG
ncbi:hypothetical protein ACU610_01925 [Geodermatophilus sp. URMC 61]|uniref:hypothetical protein n=1 Tax=Geodermatophilus sp. URMC 61 TaxID=3423411 RepID=UPI00406CEB20